MVAGEGALPTAPQNKCNIFRVLYHPWSLAELYFQRFIDSFFIEIENGAKTQKNRKTCTTGITISIQILTFTETEGDCREWSGFL